MSALEWRESMPWCLVHLDLLPSDLGLGNARYSLPATCSEGRAVERDPGASVLITDGKDPARPYELLVDGDLYTLINEIVRIVGRGPTANPKVKGHADEDMVRDGRVRELNRTGIDIADQSADFGRRRVEEGVTNARRVLARTCRLWYPIVCDLHSFFFAIARAVVKDDGKGGTVPDLIEWCADAISKMRRVVEAVKECTLFPRPELSGLGRGRDGPPSRFLITMLGAGFSR